MITMLLLALVVTIFIAEIFCDGMIVQSRFRVLTMILTGFLCVWLVALVVTNPGSPLSTTLGLIFPVWAAK